MELRQLDPWPDLFDACQRSAFHLEVRDAYAVPNESERLRRFRNGEPPMPESDPSSEDWMKTCGDGLCSASTETPLRRAPR